MFLVYSQKCVLSLKQILEHFITPERNSVPNRLTPPILPTAKPKATTDILSVSIDLLIQGISDK